MMKFFILALLLAFPRPTPLLDGITVGAFSCVPNINAMACTAAYTGDDDGDATWLVQYRVNGSGTWLDAYSDASLIDRRGGLYAVEARTAIVGLDMDDVHQTWDVQVTWTDPDGVTGTNPVVGSDVTTVSSTPTVGAGTCTATDNTTFDACVAGANATITIDGFQLTLSHTLTPGGSVGAVRKITCANGGTIATLTSASAQSFLLSSDHWWFSACTYTENYFSAIVTSGTRAGIWITGNTFSNIAAGCALGGSHTNDSGFRAVSTTTEVYILNNTIASVALLNTASPCTSTPHNSSPGQGIFFPAAPSTATNWVIKGNTISGGFKDGIQAQNSSQILRNIDIQGNTISQAKDDLTDTKGRNINIRIWLNVLMPGGIPSLSTGATCVAANTNDTSGVLYDGPVFIFRNTCYLPTDTASSSGGISFKIGGAPTYAFHNSINTSQAVGSDRWEAMGCFSVTTLGAPQPLQCPLMKSLNNAALGGGASLYGWYSGATFNYDVMDSTVSNYFRDWSGTTDYATRAAFNAATSQEANGVESSPAFTWTGSELTITSSSPAYNTGTIISNFNSLDSYWPYSGAAPDVGAYEVGGATAPVAGSGPTISALASTTLTVNWGVASGGTAPLTYGVCRSTSNNISTAVACDAALINSYTAGITSYNDTGRTPLTTYYYNVVVKDATPLSTPYTTISTTTTCGATKVVFTTQPLSASIGVPVGTVGVSVENVSNTVCTDSAVAIAIANTGGTCSGMTLTGTASGSATAGVFTTTNLAETVVGGACSLTATSSGLTDGVSNSFTVFSPTGVGAGRLILGR